MYFGERRRLSNNRRRYVMCNDNSERREIFQNPKEECLRFFDEMCTIWGRWNRNFWMREEKENVMTHMFYVLKMVALFLSVKMKENVNMPSVAGEICKIKISKKDLKGCLLFIWNEKEKEKLNSSHKLCLFCLITCISFNCKHGLLYDEL